MSVKGLDQATLRDVARLLAADTDDFNALIRLAGLDPARDFRHTDMSGTSLASADLRGFDFTGADFRNVNLDGARIDGACFNGADLSGTNLSAARGLEAADCSFAVFQDTPFAPEMVVLPSGSFLMGSPEGEAGRGEHEGPQRQVTVAGFAIGCYPVTSAEFDHFCDATGREKPRDNAWGRGRMTVIDVAWHDAVAYAAWLSEQTGKDYRLSNETEWEYACRAGTTTAYWWGDDFDAAKANTREGGPGRTTEVGSYPANPWGLFDTLGNVWEWIEDHWNGTFVGARGALAWGDRGKQEIRPRVLRGGSFSGDWAFARCACQFGRLPLDRKLNLGFRVVCSFPIMTADP